MSKFAFEGDFKRKPEQRLGGKSKVESRDAIIQKAQAERNKRERDRLRAAATLQIQASVRSYLSRQRCKNTWRHEFDISLKTDSGVDAIGEQLKRINLFCDIRLDSERFHDLGKKILAQQENVLIKLSTDITWRVRMRRFLTLCLQGVQSSRTLSRIFIRLIEVFTNLEHKGLKLSADNRQNNFVPELWAELVEMREFFTQWRCLMESQLELQRDYIANPLPLADSLILILQKPLLLAKQLASQPSFAITLRSRVMDSVEISGSIIKKFLKSFTGPSFVVHDPQVNLFYNFVVPKLRPNFPHQLLLDNLFSLNSFENPRSVIYTALVLVSDYVPSLAVDAPELEHFMNVVQLSMEFVDIKYAQMLKNLSATVDFDSDEDEDSMQIDEERDNRGVESEQIVEKLETIFNRCKDFENFFDQGDKSKWAKYCRIIGRIVHHYGDSAFTKLRFLGQLSCRKSFVKSIYKRILNLGLSDSDEVISFCHMLLNSIHYTHDYEFFTCSPLGTSEMEELIILLKNFYSEAVLNERDELGSSQSFLNKTIVRVLATLHERNTRLSFLPEEAFCCPELSAALPLDSHTIHFDDFDSTTPADRLSTVETKLMRLIKEFPFLLSFRNRVAVMHRLISTDRNHRFMPYDFNAHHIQIRRNYIYEDAFEKLSVENVPDLRGNVRISLVNVVGVMEAGVDGGGLLREFLTEATKSGVDPNRGLFRLDTQNRLYPNPIARYVVPDWWKHFTLIGRLVGKALYEQTLLELPLAAFFLELCIIKGYVSGAVDYLATLDPGLHKNLLALKNYSDEDFNTLGLDFTLTVDRLGEAITEELKPNGSSIAVSKENVIEYIHLVADYKINRETAEMCRYFRDGLFSVCPIPRLFTWKELQTLISGSDKPIDIEDWKTHTNYTGGYDAAHPMIVHFWEVVASFEEKRLRKLLKFVTSCSRPPLLGFKDLVPNFGIQSAGQTDRLPSAATCMNLLKLPEYNDHHVLREKLIYAIEAQAGFELS